MSVRSVTIASGVTVVASLGLMAVHYFGGDPNDPEGWFSAVGFGAPVLGAGVLSLIGVRFDKRELCIAGAIALAVVSVVSIVMFPLVAAAGVIVVGSSQLAGGRSFVVPSILTFALVGVFALMVFHQDPVSWSTPGGGGSSSNIVTAVEAWTGLIVVTIVLGSSAAWANLGAGRCLRA